MKLSDAACRNAKPTETARKLSDGEGLYLLVTAKGRKYWRMDFRADGRRGTLAFGTYPTVSLAEARDKRQHAKRLLAQGIDPGQHRRSEKRAAKLASANTFQAVADEFLEKLRREGRADVTVKKKEWLLGFAHPALGGRPIAQISPPELLDVLRKVETRGTFETARRLRSTCGAIFRFAIATGRAERDPTADLRGALTAPAVRHHAAITDPAGIGALLRAIDGYDGHPVTRVALRLAPLVFVRPGELRHAEWAELDFEAALWTLPAAKMKLRRPHLVPLAPQAISLLEELRPLTGAGKYVFPSLRSAARPMSENTLNAALRRLGYSKDEMSAHGFRSLASVRLNEAGWNPDAIERQLAHMEANAVRRAYIAQAEFLAERRTMMAEWADYLDGLRRGAKVLPFAAGRRRELA